MNSKEQFTEAMFFLAEVTGKDLTDLMFNFYYKEFEHEIDKTTNIILSFAKDAKWPSINQIKEKMGLSAHEPDDEQKARVLAQRVVLGIGKFGQPNEKAARAWFGDKDWTLITRYSTWSTICDINNDQLPTFQAQLREYLIAVMHQEKYDANLFLNNGMKNLIDIDSLTRKLS